MTKKYIRTKEAAQRIGVSMSTVHKMMREGLLKPVNENSYKLDGGYLFDEAEVQKLAEKQERVEGYTIKEFSELTGFSEAIIRNDVYAGKIPAVKLSQGRREWRILPNALEIYPKNKKVVVDNRTAPIYHEEYYLFQKVSKGNQTGRIIQFSHDIFTIGLLDGSTIQVHIKDIASWTPVDKITHKVIITHPGHVTFDFPIPDHIENPTYLVINLIIKHAGIENVHCVIGDKINFKVKRVSIPKDLAEWIPLLKTHLVSGDIIEKHQSYLLQPNLYSINTYVPKEIKQRIQELADKDGTSLQEKTRELILMGLERIGGS